MPTSASAFAQTGAVPVQTQRSQAVSRSHQAKRYPWCSRGSIELEMRALMLVFAEDTECSDWIIQNLQPLPADRGPLRLGHLVPSGYEKYVVVRHLADGPGNCLVAPSLGIVSQPGKVDPISLGAMLSVLDPGDDDRLVWTAWWTGWGDKSLSVLAHTRSWSKSTMVRATFDLHHESYVLLHGRVNDVRIASLLRPRMSPQFCWDRDHSWIMVTDIDSAFTIVGLDDNTASRLLKTPGLYAHTATLDVLLSSVASPKPQA